LEREEADDAAKAAAANVRLVPEDAPANQKPPGGALINMVYTDGVAASLDAGYSIDDDEPERMDPLEVIEIESVTGDGAETDGESEATPAAAAGSLLGTMEDIDRFGAKTSGESGTAASGLAALRAAVTGAEAALERWSLKRTSGSPSRTRAPWTSPPSRNSRRSCSAPPRWLSVNPL
jgi:hypothetical protein